MYQYIYCVPFGRIGTESFCRGLDPIYWALRGHRKNKAYNIINALILYNIKYLKQVGADVYKFKNGPDINAIAAVMELKFDRHKKPKYKFSENYIKRLSSLNRF